MVTDIITPNVVSTCALKSSICISHERITDAVFLMNDFG